MIEAKNTLDWMSIESQRYDVIWIIKAYSDKTGSGTLELLGKHLLEIAI